MKRHWLTALLFLCASASAVENNEVLRDRIVGEWTCKIDYPDMHLNTLDILDFQADGGSVGIGYFFFTDVLAYETKHTGQWRLDGNILSEVGRDYSTVRVHSDQTNKRLTEDQEFREMEEKLYHRLSHENNAGTPVKLEILNLHNEVMEFDQLLGDKKYAGVCQKHRNGTSNMN